MPKDERIKKGPGIFPAKAHGDSYLLSIFVCDKAHRHWRYTAALAQVRRLESFPTAETGRRVQSLVGATVEGGQD